MTSPEQHNPMSIELVSPEGVRAVVNPRGAFVESLVDTSGRQLLYHRQDLAGKDRGGVPVCAPVFGPGELVGLSQHGFARTLEWQIEPSENSNEAKFTLVNPRSQDETLPTNFEGCAMELAVQIGVTEQQDPQLSMFLGVRNFGPESFVLTPGFHPYFPAPKDGIEKVTLIDPQSKERWQYTAEQYAAVQHPEISNGHVIMATPEGQVSIHSKNLLNFVAWSANPQAYVCIEPTVAGALTPEMLEAQSISMGQECRFDMQIIWGAR